MIAKLKDQANKWLIIGFIVSVAGNILKMYYTTSSLGSLGGLVALVGAGIFIYGCMLYAQAKGQNKWLGLLGLFSLLGLIVLVLLTDKNKSLSK